MPRSWRYGVFAQVRTSSSLAPDEKRWPSCHSPLSAAFAERVGHEAVDITYRYARLFPTKQGEMAAALDGARG